MSQTKPKCQLATFCHCNSEIFEGFFGICEKALTPVDDPHLDCGIIGNVGLGLGVSKKVSLCRVLLSMIWPTFKIGEGRAVLDSGGFMTLNIFASGKLLGALEGLLFLL